MRKTSVGIDNGLLEQVRSVLGTTSIMEWVVPRGSQ